MSIEEAVAKDLVAILFVTFLFGGGMLWLIVATVAEQWRKVRVAERNAALKRSMVATGKRSSRQNTVLAGIRAITGAESATAVNNCAAATVLVLRAVAAGKEVVVSRGQLIEIGGSFRIPDIMAASGAALREVGTTNITRLSDYERAIGPNTAAIMRVHTSNYRVRGFTKTVSLPELVELGRKHNLAVIDDCGS